MKKLEKLTAEQEALMYETRDQWIERFFTVKTIDKQKFEAGIKWLYEDMLGKKNPKIVYCDSWLSALIAIAILKDNNSVGASVRASVWASVRASVRDSVWDSVRASVRASVRDSVGASVRDSVGASVRDSVRDSVGASVRDSVRDYVRASVGDSVGDSVLASVWDSVGDSVRASVGDSVGASVLASVWDSVGDSVWDSVRASFGEYSGYLDAGLNYGWVSFYDYFDRVGVLDNDKFRKYRSLMEAMAFQVYEYENIVFAVQPPSYIERDEAGRLNSTSRKAFEWSDGYGFYYISGLEVSEEMFNRLPNITFEDFIREDNEEVKSAIISYIQQTKGDAGIYDFFKDYIKEVDTYVDSKEKQYLVGTTGGMNIGVYTLFKGTVHNTEIAYVRCYCPSTDRMFFLGVDPTNSTAKNAIASLYQVPTQVKDKIVSISRQGEKFSTTFDEETTEKIRLGQVDLSSYSSISGDEYFSKITYEF